ncbi:caspase-3-like [Haliotis rubra]|uniref:caspase-3-like n=1 Tax=Haliotis rubra TaxID=36100 RepID=UPI001EE5B98A|nr:caspase-3-like [Haliotis rubra]
MSGTDDVNMDSLPLPMSLDLSQDATQEQDASSESDCSGDEEVTEGDLLPGVSDDVDIFPFTQIFNKIVGNRQPRQDRRRMSTQSRRPAQHEDEYDFSYPQRGLAVIINNETFHSKSGLNKRPGSSYDATDLKVVFKQMGFKVKSYTDLTGEQMVLKLKKIAANLKYDHTKADCFTCAILSHGDSIEVKPKAPPYDVVKCQDVVFGVDGVLVPTESLIDLFRDDYCPELEGKPRLFFIQACRGINLDKGLDLTVWKPVKHPKKRHHPRGSSSSSVNGPPCKSSPHMVTEAGDTADEADDMSCDMAPDDILLDEAGVQDDTDVGKGSSNIVVKPAPLFKDFLVMYSSPPGYFAWRRTTGTWFIQSLKKAIQSADLSTTSLSRLLTSVSHRVATGYQSQNDKEKWKDGKKQVPCVMSMLTKDVYFRPKK